MSYHELSIHKAARHDGEVRAAALVPVERVGRRIDGDKDLVGRHLELEILGGLDGVYLVRLDVGRHGANLVGHHLALKRVRVSVRGLRDADDLGVLHGRAPSDAVLAHVVLVDLDDGLANLAREFKVDILGDALALPDAVDDAFARVVANLGRRCVDDDGILHEHGQHPRAQRLLLVKLGLVHKRDLAPLAARRLSRQI
jgi:hypothetical protein